MDPVVLSYGDSLLRCSDVSLLQGPHWLNDQLIGFAFEFFSEKFSRLKDSVVFICPEVTQFIKCGTEEDDLSVFLEPLSLSRRRTLFLAVNDHQGTTSGGTHWSLLVFSREDHTFSHYDSQPGGNEAHARRIAHRLRPFLRLGTSDGGFREEACPRQQNSYDCGVYVLSVCENLCENLHQSLQQDLLQENHSENLQQNHRTTTSSSLKNITPAFISQKREEWSQIIQTLSKR